MKYAVTIDGVTRDVEIQANPDGGYLVALDDEEPRPWSGVKLEPAEWILRSGLPRTRSEPIWKRTRFDCKLMDIQCSQSGGPAVLGCFRGSSDADQGRFRLRSGAVVRYLPKPVSV